MLVALTLPGNPDVSEEISLLTAMLDSGLSYVHLRKPALSVDLMHQWLRGLPSNYSHRIVWHLPKDILGADSALQGEDQTRSVAARTMIAGLEKVQEMALSMGIRHIHVPAWFRESASVLQLRWPELLSRDLSYSTSIHHLEELNSVALDFKQHGRVLDYVTISPVFDSLSKSGYKALKGLLTDVRVYKQVFATDHCVKILALGGVQAENINTLKKYSFDGAVLNGCLWHPEYNPVVALHQFKICYKKWRE